MPKSKEELAVSVLRRIGRLATGQTASAADLKVCTDAYEQIHALLLLYKPDALVDWAAGDDIPDDAVLQMVSIVAFSVRQEFNVSGQTLQDVVAEGNPESGTAYDLLRIRIYTEWSSANDGPVEGEYF